jgi:hypothetical protein
LFLNYFVTEGKEGIVLKFALRAAASATAKTITTTTTTTK